MMLNSFGSDAASTKITFRLNRLPGFHNCCFWYGRMTVVLPDLEQANYVIQVVKYLFFHFL